MLVRIKTAGARWLLLAGTIGLLVVASRSVAADDVDNVTPRLLTATLQSSGPFQPGDTVRIFFTAEDDPTPGSDGKFYSAFARFTSPLDGYVDLEATVNGGMLSASMEFLVSDFAASGTYTLQYIEVTDSTYNAVSCDEEGLSGWAGGNDVVVASNPCPVMPEFSFTVENDAGQDLDAPQLDGDPGLPTDTYEPGQKAVVNYGTVGGGSPITRVQFLFELDGPQSHYVVGGKYGGAAGSGPLNLDIYTTTLHGLYLLDQIRLEDAVGNQSTYFRDGTVMKYPPNASGPTTHTIDFGQGFQVNSPGVSDYVYPRTINANTPQNFTLYVFGTAFRPETVVNLDSSPLVTTFISDTLVSAQVPSSLLVRAAGSNYAVRITYGDAPPPPAIPDLSLLTPTNGSTSDIDTDGCVTAMDSLQLLHVLAGLPQAQSLTSCFPTLTSASTPRLVANLDADRDGTVGLGDAVHIQRVVAGVIPE